MLFGFSGDDFGGPSNNNNNSNNNKSNNNEIKYLPAPWTRHTHTNGGGLKDTHDEVTPVPIIDEPPDKCLQSNKTKT